MMNTPDWYRSMAWVILAVFGRPESVLDVGCGDGGLVRVFRDNGVRPTIGLTPNRSDKDESPEGGHILLRQLDRQGGLGVRAAYDLVVALRAPTPDTLDHVMVENLALVTGGRCIVGVYRESWPTLMREYGFVPESGNAARSLETAVGALRVPAPDGLLHVASYTRPSVSLNIRVG